MAGFATLNSEPWSRYAALDLGDAIRGPKKRDSEVMYKTVKV